MPLPAAARRPLLLVVVALMSLSGCGSDGSDGDGDDGEAGAITTSSTAPATPSTAAADRPYCEAMQAYADATANVDISSPRTIIDGLGVAATAARAAVAVAPADSRSAHDKLAAGAEELVQALRAANVQTLEDLEGAQATIGPALEAKYGDLTAETAAVEEAAKTRCGIEPE